VTTTLIEKKPVEAMRVERRPGGVAMLVLDVPGQPHNTLSTDLLAEFESKTDALLSDPGVAAIVVCSGKPDGFIAGADLKVLEKMTREDAAELSRRGNELLGRVASAKKPVVAAVHGPALGGGLEVALACHYILATDHSSTVLALPEVMLGLLPAGGGTQRLPRRVGLVAALPMLLTGKRLRARAALRAGLVDQLTTPGGLHDTAARAAALLASGKLRRRKRKRPLWQRLAGTAPARGMVLRRAREEVMRKTRGLYPAPLAILECVETGLARGERAGFQCEARLFGDLVVSPEASSLVRMFHWNNELKKETTGVAPRPVKRVGVLGAGFMGAGIASVSVGKWPVVLRDISDDVLASAAKSVHEGLHKQQRSGSISLAERDQRWSRLLLTNDVEALRGCDLVIEAVFENLELKRKVLAEAEERLAPEAVFASNTSALPIGEIARDARHPERVLGMHYFSPVPKMPLLEIVAGKRTSNEAIETARAVGIDQGKTVIVVRDGPGFYTSRILAPFLNEATLMLAEGARIEDVDRALLDFGFPVGPIALIDEVGIDVGAHVAKDLAELFAARGGAPSDALPKLLEAGFRGRKNGKGFYTYPPEKKRGKKEPNAEVYALLGGGERRDLPAQDVRDRAILQMVNEAMYCLGEGILERPRDGDVGAVFGLGFPPFLGGPFRYVDQRGAAAVVARMEELAARHGPRFQPAPVLAELARTGKRFYA
jgi:3-hydroxyacyl-CoA dehydrogenase/enoyl-CoA hydratase/3-hydroxybutyryl-CoA epimerase